MDVEEIARECLRALGVAGPAGGFELARRAFGERVWWVRPTEVWGESERAEGGILLAEGLPIERENFRAALHAGECFMDLGGGARLAPAPRRRAPRS